jgi:hypothetical protein
MRTSPTTSGSSPARTTGRVFERVFDRRENGQESFERLFPIRILTMHSRFITLDDELYLEF